jgi:hypothetical protein
MKKTPSKKGGARKGAGRHKKPLNEHKKTTTITLRVQPQAAERLRSYCRATKQKMNALAERWISRLPITGEAD